MNHLIYIFVVFPLNMRTANLVLNGEINKEWLGRKLASDKISGLDLNIAAVMGDMDSIDKSLNTNIGKVFLPDHNFTDFEKALMHLKKDYDSVDIYGASGGDVDHFLGNLSAAKKYHKEIGIMFHEPRQYYFFARIQVFSAPAQLACMILP